MIVDCADLWLGFSGCFFAVRPPNADADVATEEGRAAVDGNQMVGASNLVKVTHQGHQRATSLAKSCQQIALPQLESNGMFSTCFWHFLGNRDFDVPSLSCSIVNSSGLMHVRMSFEGDSIIARIIPDHFCVFSFSCRKRTAPRFSSAKF